MDSSADIDGPQYTASAGGSSNDTVTVYWTPCASVLGSPEAFSTHCASTLDPGPHTHMRHPQKGWARNNGNLDISVGAGYEFEGQPQTPTRHNCRDIDVRTLKPPQLALKPHTNTAGNCNRPLYCLDVQTFSSSVMLSLDLDDLPSISSLYSSSCTDKLGACFTPDDSTYAPPFLDHNCFPPATESPSPSPVERTSLITANIDGEWQEIAYPSLVQLPLVSESTANSDVTLSLTSILDFEPLEPLLAISPLWAVNSTNSRADYSYTEHTAAAASTREERSQGRSWFSSHSGRIFGSSSTVQPFPSTASIFYGSPLEVGIQGAPFVGNSRDESAELDTYSSAFDSYNDSRLDFTLSVSPESYGVRRSCSIRRQAHLFANKGIGSTKHSGYVSDEQPPHHHSLFYEDLSESEPSDDDLLGGLGNGDWSFDELVVISLLELQAVEASQREETGQVLRRRMGMVKLFARTSERMLHSVKRRLSETFRW